MSFEQVETINLDCQTINNAPYPPLGSGIEVIDTVANSLFNLTFTSASSGTIAILNTDTAGLQFNPLTKTLRSASGVIVESNGNDIELKPNNLDNVVLNLYDPTQKLVFKNGSNQTIGVKISSLILDYEMVLPGIQGSNGDTLINDGSGNLSWGSAGSTIPSYKYYVNSTLGNDANTGAFDNPVASISQAITLINASGSAGIINVTDDATYVENLIINNQNININAPFAILSPASGDAITVSLNYASSFIFSRIICASSSNYALNCPGYGVHTLIVKGDVSGGIQTEYATIIIDIKGGIYANNFHSINGGSMFGFASTMLVNTITFDAGGSLNIQTDNGGTLSGGVQNYLPNNINNVFSLTNYNSFAQTAIKNADLNSNIIIAQIAVTYLDLVGSFNFNLFQPSIYGTAYRIRDIKYSNGTVFAGGDRDLRITDGVNVWSLIPSASLLTLVNSSWGSVALPLPTSTSLTQILNSNLYCETINGTTDYTSGEFNIILTIERTA
jgi:hypothetical protein